MMILRCIVGEREAAAVREVLFNHHQLLYGTFYFYANVSTIDDKASGGMSGGSIDVYSINLQVRAERRRSGCRLREAGRVQIGAELVMYEQYMV